MFVFPIFAEFEQHSAWYSAQFQFPAAPVDSSTQISPLAEGQECSQGTLSQSLHNTHNYQHWGSSAPTCYNSSYHKRARAVRKDQHHYPKKRVLALYSRECGFLAEECNYSQIFKGFLRTTDLRYATTMTAADQKGKGKVGEKRNHKT